tara:strand:- start:101 stop:280 length:180 start_codon:yes stop_codon:yes gene_type:complete
MLTYYTLIYFLAGTVTGFFMELAVVSTGNNLSWGERVSMITFWPIMVLTFVINFFRGFL